MKSRVAGLVGMVTIVGAILALPAIGYAQDVTLSGRVEHLRDALDRGTVTDSTGGVVPGAAMH